MDAIKELEIEAAGWVVYEESCCECGKRMAIVATVHSVEHGYAEWFRHRTCSVCTNRLLYSNPN